MISTRQGLINQEETDTEMDRVAEALQLIFQSESRRLSFQKTYNSVYRLCRQGLHQELADLAISKVTQYFANVVSSIKIVEGRVGEVLSNTVSSLIEISQRILQIFLYLEANHRQRQGAPSLRIVFNNILFETLTKKKELMEKFVFQIAELKISGDLGSAKKFICIISNIDENETFISQSFLPVYIPRMTDFFNKTSENKIRMCQARVDLRAYLLWATDMLNNEKEFMSTIVSRGKFEGKQEFDSVINEIYEIILTKQKKKIYELDPKRLFSDDTPALLELLSKVGNNDIKEHVAWYIGVVKGELANLNRTQNQYFLESFIRLYQKVTDFLLPTAKGFSISYKVKLVFEEWVNEERINLPYRLNLYINHSLIEIQGNKENTSTVGVNQSIPNTFVSHCQTLFKLLKKKDEFEKGYRKMIVKRKINNVSDQTLENRLIEIMTIQCGQQWIEKIENLRTSIKQHNKLKKPKGKIDAIAFEEAAWPYEKENFNSLIAPELMNLAADFEKKYLESDKRKKLKWHPTLGTAKVGIKFLNGQSRNFIVDTCQACMLLFLRKNRGSMRIEQFAKQNYFTTEQIKEPFKKLLKSGLLICDEKNFLHLNEQFLNNASNLPMAGECIDLTEDENAESIESVQMEELKADRKLMVEAMIIKIMKASKVSTREQVLKRIIPVIESKGFKYNKQFVLESISRLLDKEYIRDFNDGSLGYIA